jgi:hypothetical protein
MKTFRCDLSDVRVTPGIPLSLIAELGADVANPLLPFRPCCQEKSMVNRTFGRPSNSERLARSS